MTVGERIKKARQEKGISQTELAERLGYKSRSSINKIEVEGRDIPRSMIVKFAQALGVTPAYLMGWENESDNTEPTVSETYNLILKVFGKQTAELIHLFNSFNDEGKEKLLDTAQDMAQLSRYKKECDESKVVSEEA